VPIWWTESILIEYSECRGFGGERDIWDFDASMVDTAGLIEAVSTHRVVLGGPVLHNTRKDVWIQRTLGRMTSDVPVPIAARLEDAIPEGPISAHHFYFRGNDISLWDPKLGFSEFMQIRDDDGFWQWRVARFEVAPNQSYGRWVSDYVDLDDLQEVDGRLAELRNPPRRRRPDEPGHAEFVEEVADFYAWLESVRAPIRTSLWEVHRNRRQASWRDSRSATPPPRLCKFEEFRVDNGRMTTRLHGDPLFFRECVRFSLKGGVQPDAIDQLDDLISSRVQAVMNAAFCLEAVANQIGEEYVPHWNQLFSGLGVEGKWQVILTTAGSPERYRPGAEPYQTLGKIVRLRNHWVHYRAGFDRVKILKRGSSQENTVTWIEAEMGHAFIQALPRQLRSLVGELYEGVGLPRPQWLDAAPGWVV
jgi:hypothetical protein